MQEKSISIQCCTTKHLIKQFDVMSELSGRRNGDLEGETTGASGRRNGDLETTDASKKLSLCDACKQNNENNAEVGKYCLDCRYYLCKKCVLCHLKSLLWKQHRIVDTHEALQNSMATVKYECIERCQKERHQQKREQYFCRSHNVFACSICITLEHRMCDVCFIPAIAGSILESTEYIDYKEDLTMLLSDVKETKVKAVDNHKTAVEESERSFQMIRDQRRKVNEFFDKIEKKTRQQVSELKSHEEKTSMDVISKCDKLTEELKRTESVLKRNETEMRRCQLFVCLKTGLGRLETNKSLLGQMKRQNSVHTYDFVPSKFIIDVTTEADAAFGEIVMNIHDNETELNKPKPVHVSDICLFGPDEDARDFNITGILTLPGNRIVVTESSSKCVKLIKFGLKMPDKLLAEITFENAPWGITTATENTVAVTQPNTGLIKILKVGNGLSRVKEIKVGKSCYGICKYKDRFIVSFVECNETIKIVSLSGRILKKFDTGKRDGFTNIAVNISLKQMYLSGPGGVVECRSTSDGTLIHHITRGNTDIGGIAVAGNRLVIQCMSRSDLLQTYSSDLMSRDIILCGKDGIKEPLGLAYCGVTRKLFVGLSNGIVKVFHLDQSQVETIYSRQ